MFTVALSIVLVASLKTTAPIPPERAKIPTVRTVLVKQGWGRSLDAGPAETAVEFNVRTPGVARFKTYTTSEELLKQFRDTDTLKKQLAEKFDPKRHVLLFARWYSWSARDHITLTVADDLGVQFLHHAYEPLVGDDKPRKTEFNVVFVIDKNAKWRLSTVAEDK
jgi:hypothetical protein